MDKKFTDRDSAGLSMADQIDIKNSGGTVVVAIPYGGVPIAYQISKKHTVPIKICMTTRITVPGHPQLSVGAMSITGDVTLDSYLVNYLEISKGTLNTALETCRKKISDVSSELSQWGVDASLEGKHVLVVDDVIATGLSMIGAVKHLQSLRPKSISAVSPVISLYASKLLTDRKIGYSTMMIGDESEFKPEFYYSNLQKISAKLCKTILGTSELESRTLEGGTYYDKRTV